FLFCPPPPSHLSPLSLHDALPIFLRSPHPHARIRKIETARAAAHPGVYLVLTGKDVPIQYGILPVSQDEQALCVDRVRHVGDPRSEEHTSELQSLRHLVCRLLLEK